MVTIPLIGWVGKNGPGGTKLASFSAAKYGAAAGLRLELVPRRLQRRPHERHQRHRQRPQRRQRAVERPVPEGVGPAPRLPLGRRRERRRALLHLRQRAQPLARTPTATCTRPAQTMTELRDLMIAYGTAIRQADPGAVFVGPEEWGWTRLLLLRLRPEVRQRDRLLVLRPRQDRERRHRTTCRGCSPRCASTSRPRATACSTCFTLHYYPQGGEFWERHLELHAGAAQPLHALAVGPELHGRDAGSATRSGSSRG